MARPSVLALLLLVMAGFGSMPAVAAEDGAGGVVGWLMASIDPARDHQVDGMTAWHGRLMVLVWVVLFPIGVITARFFKVMPGQDWPRELDNKGWWRVHIATQYTGGALLLVGLWLALQAGDHDGAGLYHRIFGWIVIVFAGCQFLGGWFRGSKGGPTAPAPDGSLRGDHYDMTRHRRIFEYAHKTGGYLALVTAFMAIATGLHLANAPRWMALGLLIGLLSLAGLAIWLQSRGLARDTYEAIWGPGAEHPGNQRPPIGLGVRRVGNAGKRDRAR